VQLHQDYVQRPSSRGCVIIGDEGKILMSLSNLTIERYDGQGRLAEQRSFEGFPRNQLFLKEMQHFLDCVGGRATPLINLRDGAQSLRMALAAKESLVTKQVVELRDN
jgi:predicted dehydrogenase